MVILSHHRAEAAAKAVAQDAAPKNGKADKGGDNHEQCVAKDPNNCRFHHTGKYAKVGGKKDGGWWYKKSKSDIKVDGKKSDEWRIYTPEGAWFESCASEEDARKMCDKRNKNEKNTDIADKNKGMKKSDEGKSGGIKDMKKFSKAFGDAYDYFYDNDDFDKEADFMEKFDAAVKKDPTFKKAVEDFNAYRKDYITSDREAAAFWSVYNGIDPSKKDEGKGGEGDGDAKKDRQLKELNDLHAEYDKFIEESKKMRPDEFLKRNDELVTSMKKAMEGLEVGKDIQWDADKRRWYKLDDGGKGAKAESTEPMSFEDFAKSDEPEAKDGKDKHNAYFDYKVRKHFEGLLAKGANGHDFMAEVETGKFAKNSRSRGIAKKVWEDKAKDYPECRDFYDTVMSEFDKKGGSESGGSGKKYPLFETDKNGGPKIPAHREKEIRELRKQAKELMSKATMLEYKHRDDSALGMSREVYAQFSKLVDESSKIDRKAQDLKYKYYGEAVDAWRAAQQK